MPDHQLPTRLERKVIYESPWVNLYRDRVALHNGHIYEQYHILDFGPGSVVVLVENAQGEILLERIARYPTLAVSWELPAGSIDEGETALAAASREVFEETGYETHGHQWIYQYHPLNGISNMTVQVIHCQAATKTGTPDQNEVIETRWFSLQQIQTMIASKEITDGMTLIGLLLHQSMCAE